MHFYRLVFVSVASAFLLVGCSAGNTGKYYDRDGPPAVGGTLRAATAKTVTPKVEAPNKWANRPYTVMGKRYTPMSGDKPLTQVGVASWYGKQFHGKKTAIGEKYDMYQLSAAHPTMELPSYARVTNLANGRSIIVRVNDRGPFLNNRVMDLSYAAAVQLGYQKAGTTRVRIERITRADIAAGRVPGRGITGLLAAVATLGSTQSKTASPSSSEKVSSATPSTSKPTVKTVTPPVTAPIVVAAQAPAAVPNPTAPSAPTAREPIAALDITVEDAVDSTQAASAPSVAQAAEAPSSSSPADDAIAAILHEETRIAEQIAAAAPAAPEPPLEVAPADVAVPEPRWGTQIGAYSMQENAEAAAAHAEMMLSGETGAEVRVVPVGNVYKVIVGRLASRDEAAELSRRIADKLGQNVLPVCQ
ncbi:MAG: septal ring lytic transglycosylase RlpA family protein [Duodenibacillus sp.]